MDKSYKELDLTVDVQPLQEVLINHPEYFGEYKARFEFKDSPHREVTDIWVRYNDIQPFLEGKSMAEFADEHDSIWYPVVDKLLGLKDIVFNIMNAVDGERLGGVLITKLPPGGQVYPHTDSGWHAQYYDKFYVPVLNKDGSNFYFDDGVIEPEEGRVYQFNNSLNHWIKNESDTDRIAMVVCIKTGKTLIKEGDY